MLNASKFNAWGRRRLVVLGGSLFAAVLALFPAPAEAQCLKWDVSGKWNINITSGIRKGTVLKIDLQQSGDEITGGTERFQGIGLGTLSSGTLNGKNLGLVFEWKGQVDPAAPEVKDPVEMFVGEIDDDGKVTGVASIFSDRSRKATWTSDRAMRCRFRIEPEKLPKTPFILGGPVSFPDSSKSTGVSILKWDAGPEHPNAQLWVKVDDGDKTLFNDKRVGALAVFPERDKRYFYTLTDAGQTLASITVTSNPIVTTPGIVASQAIFPNPYVHTGFVILAWDAGPDHPYAEVWFKINNGDEVSLVEQGKGSRQIPVERGKLYQYILTDAGKTLATVSFLAQ